MEMTHKCAKHTNSVPI